MADVSENGDAGVQAPVVPAWSEADEASLPRFGWRWTIVAMLFFATTINYIDRQVLSILAPTLQREFGWSEAQYSRIVICWTLAYGLGFLGVGRLLDRVGVKRGFAMSIAVWSLAAMSHALARTVTQFSLARAALGLGESANFPASIKAVAEWFPKRERALATGIFNAGSNVGAIVAPILVPIIALHLGWRFAFLFTGLLVVVWLLLWWRVYHEPERHPRVSRAELAWARSDPADPVASIPWLHLLRYRQTWAFVLGKFMTDPIWWFYLFWLPKFLDSDFGIHLKQVALPLVVIYVAADVGSIFGGWLSGRFIKGGRTVNFGRKVAMLIAACAIVPTMFAPHARSMWVAVAIVSVAASCHQWWSANLFTTTSDMFPRKAVASVVGLGGFAGAMGGLLFQFLTGQILQATGSNYSIIFGVCGLAYVSAWLVFQALVPRLQPVEI